MQRLITLLIITALSCGAFIARADALEKSAEKEWRELKAIGLDALVETLRIEKESEKPKCLLEASEEEEERLKGWLEKNWPNFKTSRKNIVERNGRLFEEESKSPVT